MHIVHDHVQRVRARLSGSVEDLGRALDELRWATASAVCAEHATLYLLDPVERILVSRSVDLPAVNHIRLRLGEGVAGRCAATGETQWKHPKDPRSAAAEQMDERTGYLTRTLLAVPIALGGRVVGVLQGINKVDGDFDAADERMLLDVADALAELLAGTALGSQLESSRLPLRFQFNQLVGDAAPMRDLYDLVARAAATDITVLLSGPSGSGKSLLARALHDNSARRDKPFVVVDCGAIADTLVENELFGHEPGAFTGAGMSTDGKVAAAEGGTLFLDEVGDLSPHAQRKLLRLLQDRTYHRLGSNVPRTVDVRFVCATHHDLAAAVADGRFRADLLHRLRVVELRVPSLVERGPDDLDRLIDLHVYEHGRRHGRPTVRLTDAARAALHRYPWPGNVRELRHVLEAAIVLSRTDDIGPDDLRLAPGTSSADPDVFQVGDVRSARDVQRAYARWALERHDGNRSATARALDVGRNTLASWLDPT